MRILEMKLVLVSKHSSWMFIQVCVVRGCHRMC